MYSGLGSFLISWPGRYAAQTASRIGFGSAYQSGLHIKILGGTATWQPCRWHSCLGRGGHLRAPGEPAPERGDGDGGEGEHRGDEPRHGAHAAARRDSISSRHAAVSRSYSSSSSSEVSNPYRESSVVIRPRWLSPSRYASSGASRLG